MRFDSITSFQKHLADALLVQPLTSYLIIVKDPFELEEATLSLYKALLNTNSPIHELIRCDHPKEHFQPTFLQWIHESFLTDRQFLQIKQTDKLSQEQIAQIVPWIQQTPPNRYLLLIASSLAKTHPIYKAIEKAGAILELRETKPWEKEKRGIEWLQRALAQEKKTISYPHAASLVKRTGGELSLLRQELNKLLCAIGSKTEITFEDIQHLSPNYHLESLWELGDAILSRDFPKSYAVMVKLLSHETAAIPLIRHLRSQFETGYEIALLLRQKRQEEIPLRFPHMKGKLLEKHMHTANDYTLPAYRKALLAIDKSERELKSTAVSDKHTLTHLLLNLIFRESYV